MRAICFLLGSTFLLVSCSQALDYTYSKKNFTTSSFQADLSACRQRTRSISAFQTPPPEQLAQLDDAAERDCMISKGYTISTEGR